MTESAPVTRAPTARAPRLRPLTGFGPLFAWGLRFTLRGKRFLLVVGLSALVGAALGSEGAPGQRAPHYDPSGSLARTLDEAVLPFALPLIALVLLAQGFAREVSERTLVFHLVRPVSRATIFLARFASGLVPALLATLVLVGTVLATSGVAMPAPMIALVLLSALVGVCAVGAVYYTLGAMFRYGTIAGLVYTFVVEVFLSSARGSMQKLSLTYHVRSLHHRVADWVLPPGDRPPTSLAEEPRLPDPSSGNVLLQTAEQIGYETPTNAILVLAVVAAAALAIGSWHVSRRDFALKD